MKTFLLLTSFFLSIALNAQSSSNTNSKTDSLHYKQAFFRIYPVILNNGNQLNKNEEKIFFSKVPEAAVLYKKYKNKYKVGLYSLLVSVAGTAISALSFDEGNRSLTAVGLTVSIYSFINGIVFLSLGDAKLRRAIKAYNKSILKY